MPALQSPSSLPGTMTSPTQEMPVTPGPTRARVNHLQNQISDLVRRSHAAERKHQGELAALNSTVEQLHAQLKESEGWKKKAEVNAEAMGRIKVEGEGMREELHLHSFVAQQKALLAVLTEQMGMLDMEHRLLQYEAERVMRDHKTTLFEGREEEMNAELAEKEAQNARLEEQLIHANTSVAHQQAAENKAVREESKALEQEIQSLRTQLKSTKEKEKAAREDLAEHLSQAKSSDGSTEKEKSDLKKGLREAKVALSKKEEQLADVQEELASLKEASREREKTLKAKVKEAIAERDRLVGVEVELESLRSTARAVNPSKPKEKPTRKTPSDDSEDEVVPPKKQRAQKKAPLAQHLSNDAITKAKSPEPSNTAGKSSPSAPRLTVKVTDHDTGEETSVAEPEKKKKRKLFASAPAFAWDPIMNSADGVIPAYLSPLKPSAKEASAGMIPRKGFPSLASSRSFGRLA